MALKKIIYILALGFCLSIGQTKAFAGGVGGGGNDPRATELLGYGRGVVAWLISMQNANKYPYLKTSKLLARIEKLSATLDRKDPWIKFFEIGAMNCFGTTKKACTYDNGRIDVAGLYWEKASELDKCELSIVELMRTSGNQELSHLYETASGLCKQIYHQESEVKEVKDDGVPTYELDEANYLDGVGKYFYVKNNPDITINFVCSFYGNNSVNAGRVLIRIVPIYSEAGRRILDINHRNASDIVSRSKRYKLCEALESYTHSKIQTGKTVVFKVLQDGFMIDGTVY